MTTIVLSQTSDGKKEYLQIMSEDMVSVNIVLVDDSFEIDDKRPGEEGGGK